MGISFREIADLIGMSEQNLHRCVRQNRIQADVLKRIADILGVNINFFFDDKVNYYYGNDSQHVLQIDKIDTSTLKQNGSDDSELHKLKKELEVTKDRLLEVQAELISVQRTVCPITKNLR